MNRTYEEIAQQALDAAAAENNKQRKRLIAKKVTLLSASAAMLTLTIFALSRAWFTNNKDVSAAGMGVKSTDLPFEIAAKGDVILNDTEFTAIKERTNSYTEGTPDDDKVYYTGDGSATLMLRADTGTEEDAVPGSSGTVEFYVIPKQNGELNLTITLNVVGYVKTETGVYKSVSELTDDTKYDNYVTAQKYLQGHILFFEEKANRAEYSYSGFLENSTDDTTNGITYTYNNYTINGTAGSPSEVTIEWVWPGTIGQLASTEYIGSGNKSIVNKDVVETDVNSDLSKVRTYLKNNIPYVFAPESTTDETTGETKTTQKVDDDIINGIDNTDTTTNISTLSDAYNRADNAIGNNLDYFMIEVTVQLDTTKTNAGDN